jgi:pimeloyl-ACP methyl ester carboxylesterase
MASGLRALTPDWNSTCSPVAMFACLDPFNNAALATKIQCPVLIAHGAADSEVVLA